MSDCYDDHLVDCYIAEMEYEEELKQKELLISETAHYARIAYATNKWVDKDGNIVDLMKIDVDYFNSILAMFKRNGLLSDEQLENLCKRKRKSFIGVYRES